MRHVVIRRPPLRKPLARRRLRAGLAALLLIALVVAAADLLSRRIGPTRVLLGDATGDIATPLPAGSRIDYRRLDARLTRLAGEKGIVGFAVAVVEQGQIRFLKGYGVREPGSAEPVDLRTRFAWASLSKTVAATMIGTLAGDGRVSLTEPIATYRTTLRLPDRAEHRVTIEDVLSHRTGLVKNAWDDRLEDGEDPAVIRGEYPRLSNFCRPGTCFTYQNIAFDATHEVIESATGLPYPDALRRDLFAPLGMTGASVGDVALQADADWARPTNGVRAFPLQRNYYHVPAAGGVNSTIVDLAIWLRAQMGGAPGILPPALLDELHRTRVATPASRGAEHDRVMKDTSYALGFRNASYEGRRLIGHRGAVRGYRSLMSFDPAAGMGVAVLWNSESTRPVAIPLEVWDMIAGRPQKDWLRLDEARPAS